MLRGWALGRDNGTQAAASTVRISAPRRSPLPRSLCRTCRPWEHLICARTGRRAAGWHFSSVDNRRRRRPADGGMPAVAVCASNVCGLPANGVRSRRGRDIVLFSRFPRSFTLSSFAKLSSTAERVGLHGPTHNYYHYTDR